MKSPHPVQARPDLSLEQQVDVYREQLAQLWDMVWWLALPVERRTDYERQGFTAPIRRFYLHDDHD